MNAPVLETGRLRLRPATLEDLAALHALWTDAQVRRWLFDDCVITESAARTILETSCESFGNRGFGHWVVSEREAAPLIGCAGLSAFDAGREIELIYAFHPSRWRAGLATEASLAVLDHAFRTLGLARVAARADVPNLESIRLMKRLGMRFEDERPLDGRPTVHYAIDRDAFLSQNP